MSHVKKNLSSRFQVYNNRNILHVYEYQKDIKKTFNREHISNFYLMLRGSLHFLSLRSAH